MFELSKIIRPNIWKLKPYSCARDEFKGEASVYLDANENPYNNPFNRYPDPLQLKVKEQIKKIKGISKRNIFLGNGSDEAIDLVYRIFCEPKEDNVIAIAPTYGMYGVCADINNVQYKSIELDENFQFSADTLLEKVNEKTRVIWLCSPNNPTGNALNGSEIEKLLKSFNGIVVVDEAYIDFSSQPSWTKRLKEFPNLIVLQTLSKAWASAGIRLGMAFASENIIALFNKVKYPYNVNILTQKQALNILTNKSEVDLWIKTILEERGKLINELQKLPIVEKIYPTDANFILVKVQNANKTYNHLVSKGIIVRNRNTVILCDNCLRITVGTPEENKTLLKELKNC
ncbi:MAG: histidinol-phosphate transaminase [Paludibacteraceae bacterium]|nr:histidinol-phosphate transaminase [Paludibacteraceae bacterium]MBR2262407.1 histidinol-phosphate transaminase [Paludibacteraceae bacterium]MEE3484055.1 histidinol-phosphate transaminase [Bacteroidales bacterium]